MVAIYEYTGVVETVLPLQTFQSGFTKRDVVLTDDIGQQSRYPNHIAFTFKKENTNLLDNVKKGQRAKVRFAIDGRVWLDPKTNNERYFTDLTGLKLEILNEDGSSTEPTPVPAVPDFDYAGGDMDGEEMPF